eukprot:jgi/Orpsp1_1/1189650/evm.model.d7180000073510.1
MNILLFHRGADYRKTWTWEKVFEYSEIIKNCTGKPGLKHFGYENEDLKFFITLCQSLNIPFFTEGENNVKKCGFRSDENREKLKPLKKLIENHYIEIYEDSEKKRDSDNYDYMGNYNVNGMIYDSILTQ